MPVTKASLSLPPARLAAFFARSSGTVMVSKCTDSERPVMRGLSGCVAGRRTRPMEAARSAVLPTACTGSERAFAAPDVTEAAERFAIPIWRRRACWNASTIRSGWLITWISGGSGIGRSGAFGSRSSSSSWSCMPPTPSVMAWWSLSTIADWRSARPSTTTARHSGRARSKPLIATGSAIDITSRIVPLPGAFTHHRWKCRSKCGSTSQRGGATDIGLARTR